MPAEMDPVAIDGFGDAMDWMTAEIKAMRWTAIYIKVILF